MGRKTYTAMTRKGQTGCEGTEWESETSVRCLVGQGGGGTRRVVMTAGERSGSMSEGYSVDEGRMSVMGGRNRAGTGSGSVTVQGAGVGLVGMTAMVRAGQTGCEGTEWESDTSVRCLAEHGQRGTRRIFVTAGVQVITFTESFSFDSPSLSLMFPTNNPTTGKISATVRGSSIGIEGDSQAVRLGGSACEQTTWTAETALRCKTPAGIRGTRKVVATTGQRVGSRTEIFSHNAAPGVSSKGSSNKATTGSQVITLSGLKFGTRDYTDKNRFGFTAGENTIWTSDTAVTSLGPSGIRTTRRVVMTVRKYLHANERFLY